MRERLAAARGDESRRASEFALRVMQERHVVEQQVCVCVGVWKLGRACLVFVCGYLKGARKRRK